MKKVVVAQNLFLAEPRTGMATRDAYRLLDDITRKLNEADAVTAVTTADASDLATVITLANALKVKLNSLIAALQK